MLTNQECFDKVATHLITQGRQALNGSNKCQYRTDVSSPSVKPLRCAAGCLIPDDRYDPAMEGQSIVDLLYPRSDGDRSFNIQDLLPKDLTLILALQSVHDTTFYNEEVFPEDYCLDDVVADDTGRFDQAKLRDALRVVARYFSLSDAVLA